MIIKTLKNTALQLSAAQRNGLLSRHPQIPFASPTTSADILVRNATEELLEVFHAVELHIPTFHAADNFLATTIADGVVMEVRQLTSNPAAIIAIIQQNLNAGDVGRAVVLGITAAHIRVHDADHQYAFARTLDGVLDSTADPTAISILWAPSDMAMAIETCGYVLLSGAKVSTQYGLLRDAMDAFSKKGESTYHVDIQEDSGAMSTVKVTPSDMEKHRPGFGWNLPAGTPVKVENGRIAEAFLPELSGMVTILGAVENSEYTVDLGENETFNRSATLQAFPAPNIPQDIDFDGETPVVVRWNHAAGKWFFFIVRAAGSGGIYRVRGEITAPFPVMGYLGDCLVKNAVLFWQNLTTECVLPPDGYVAKNWDFTTFATRENLPVTMSDEGVCFWNVGQWIGFSKLLDGKKILDAPTLGKIVANADGETVDELSRRPGLVNGKAWWSGDDWNYYYDADFGYVFSRAAAGTKMIEYSWQNRDSDGNLVGQNHVEGTAFYTLVGGSDTTSSGSGSGGGITLTPRGALTDNAILIIRDAEPIYVKLQGTDYGEYQNSDGERFFFGCRKWTLGETEIIEGARPNINPPYNELEAFSIDVDLSFETTQTIVNYSFNPSAEGSGTSLLTLQTPNDFDGKFVCSTGIPNRGTHSDLVFTIDYAPFSRYNSFLYVRWHDFLFDRTAYHSSISYKCGNVFDPRLENTPNGELKFWIERLNAAVSWFEMDITYLISNTSATWTYFHNTPEGNDPVVKADKMLSWVDFLEAEKAGTPMEIYHADVPNHSNLEYFQRDPDDENGFWICANAYIFTRKLELNFACRDMSLTFTFSDYVQGNSTATVYFAYPEVWQ